MDSEEVKDQVRETLKKPKFHIASLYHTTGFCQQVARSAAFEQMTLAIVSINAIWVAIDTDYNTALLLWDSHPMFIFVENCFCILFTLEWLIRFASFQRKCDMYRDRSLVFDTMLVFTMLLETYVLPLVLMVSHGAMGSGDMSNASVLRMVRLLRLSRMARVARVLRAVPELVIMIKAMTKAMRSVMITLILLVTLLYVFGIAFAQLTAGHRIQVLEVQDAFPSVPRSMYTLLLHGVLSLSELEPIASQLAKINMVLPVFLFVFVLLGAFTVMNMLIGILCEVVSATAAVEKEAHLVDETKRRVYAALQGLDTDDNGLISKNEFVQIVSNPLACKALDEVGVDVIALVDFADTLFWDSFSQTEVEMEFEAFMDIVLTLRNTNTATQKDVFNLSRLIRACTEKLDRNMATILPSSSAPSKSPSIAECLDDHMRACVRPRRQSIMPS
jgi:hypothetical protein